MVEFVLISINPQPTGPLQLHNTLSFRKVYKKSNPYQLPEEDTQEHLLSCDELVSASSIVQEVPKYSNIFGEVVYEILKVTTLYLKISNKGTHWSHTMWTMWTKLTNNTIFSVFYSIYFLCWNKFSLLWLYCCTLIFHEKEYLSNHYWSHSNPEQRHQNKFNFIFTEDEIPRKTMPESWNISETTNLRRLVLTFLQTASLGASSEGGISECRPILKCGSTFLC